MSVYVQEGWWHSNVKAGQVHDHKQSQPPTMHRLCEPVYTKRRGDASDSCGCGHERGDHDQGEGREGCQVVVSMRPGREYCPCDGFRPPLWESDRVEVELAAADDAAGENAEERWYALHDGWVR
jgi:hypothetical protein